MSENPSPDQPAGNPSGQAGAQDDIDSLLANAADLAAGIGDEVGVDQPAGSGLAADIEQLPAEGDSDTKVEEQLDQIDSLLDRACKELGPGTEPVPPATEPAPTQQPAATSASSPGEADGPTPTDPTQAPGVGALAPEDMADLEGVPDFGDGLDSNDVSGTDTAPPATAKDTPSQHEAPGDAQAVQPARGEPGRLAGLADKAIGVLDLIDRPFAWVSYSAREVVGWVALLTLLAAACVLIMSFLR